MDIVEFLNARIEEDEAAIAFASKAGVAAEPFALARLRREVAAKRAVLGRHKISDEENDSVFNSYSYGTRVYGCVGCGWYSSPELPWSEDINECPELRDVASVYADHPDFEVAWKP
jgi:hypothetical protein